MRKTRIDPLINSYEISLDSRYRAASNLIRLSIRIEKLPFVFCIVFAMGSLSAAFISSAITVLPRPQLKKKAKASLSSTFHPYASIALTSSTADLLHRPPTSDPTPLTVPEFLRHAQRSPSDGGAGGKSGKILVWFRADLRLADNPALAHAVEEASQVIPIFCFDPRHFGRTPFGFEKTGRIRAQFLIEAVTDLRKSLESLGSGMIVRVGKPEEVIPDVCRKTGCKKVFYHHEVTYEAQSVEQSLEKTLKSRNVECKSFWSNTLYYPEDMPCTPDTVPDIYTKFREIMQAQAKVQEPIPAPKEMPPVPKIDKGKIPTLGDLDLKEFEPQMWDAAEYIPGGETEAKKRLGKHIEEMRRIPLERRTSIHLASDFSCRISPWLALGCLSPRNIYAEVKKYSSKDGTKSTTFYELLWRDFFRFITYKYGHARLEKRRSAPARTPHAVY